MKFLYYSETIATHKPLQLRVVLVLLTQPHFGLIRSDGGEEKACDQHERMKDGKVKRF